MSWCALALCRGRVAACGRPCRRVSLRVCAPCRSLSAFTPGHETKIVSRDNSLLCAVSLRVARAQRCIVAHPASYRSLYRCPYCDINATLSHDTILVSRHSLARACARALPHALRAGRPCRGLYRGPTTPCHGRGLAVSWPLQLCPAALCHDTIHCIVTQMGSSLSNCLLSRIFFSHHFFFSFQLLENHQKKYLFFFIFQ